MVLDPLIGASFGSTWGVTTEEDAQLVQREPEPVWDDITSTTKNNSQILANGNAQKLTQEEILQLQASGKDGTLSRDDANFPIYQIRPDNLTTAVTSLSFTPTQQAVRSSTF